jgi:glycosyltransferase involved in cell wall biosynthesis
VTATAPTTEDHVVAPRVVVAMLTYRRPDDLDAAVPSLVAQLDNAEFDASLLVVDNDPEGTAMVRSDQFTGDRVRFVHEPTPGIAAARNRALDEAGEARILVFVDDDERPSPDWLALLVATWRRSRADAVVGPVVSTYPSEPEAWIREGRVFDRRRLPTGTETDIAATNNLLLDLDTIRRLGLRFDERFSASGGSDTFFTRQLHQRGGRLVWCDEAVVTDVVPPSRLTREWVLRRALRLGNSHSRTAIALEDGALGRTRRRLVVTGEGLLRLAGGTARWLFGMLRGSIGDRARGHRMIMRGLGMTGGAWGYTYVEYRRHPEAPR